VFGIIKSALGFRQFSLRGLDKVRVEWSLVTMAWNLKRIVRPRLSLTGRQASQPAWQAFEKTPLRPLNRELEPIQPRRTS
jgi:Transposase DDE domain